MIQYKAPIKDIQFLMNDVFDFQQHYQQIPGGEEATPDMVDAILGEAARFSEEVLSPLYQTGDDGCVFNDGDVTTPKGFREAYGQYVEGGWQGMSAPVEYGGQGLPLSLGVIKSEMIGTANWVWGMYPGLSLGAMNTIYMHGSEEQKQTYLVPLTEGRWTGTMCLTEPQCGTDLGQVKTKAVPNGDGSYAISGTKIFISSGEHDLTEQIVHIVLARLPDAPKGTKGISLFIVPKFNVNQDGSLGDRNPVVCGSIEEKMGIHGSSTCMMNFDGAKGFLIGPKNKGLMCMFTFMNTARIGTSIQGVGAAELSFQGALPYARERRSMRSLSGTKQPEKIADALIVHPDVRRMLLTQKAIAEGGRAMLYYAAQLADHMMAAHSRDDQAEYDRIDDKLGFLTPVLKAFLTELGYEAANQGVQVYGGHGFIKEWGMEQIIRDTQIAKLYEGTTGVQALDLLGRKVLLGKLKSFNEFHTVVKDFIKQHQNRSDMKPMIKQLKRYLLRWRLGTLRIAFMARKDRDMVGAASVDYLMFSGYVMMAYFWARMADSAYSAISRDPSQADFYRAKIHTAEFYFDRMLPRAKGHAKMMVKPARTLMQMSEDHFSF
ncbi:acyl-CoA dehydrogenase [Bacterioplanes sanyensis]|uniref:3-methylmercaptopropionyl-CoA dehydrogenase n=1 Tax=Bacterioplanes sanyensis TaxID=1249553 RepID=A0A222FI07_9GAMM|nr:acyl-CoA dehydrogenase C-terminal domain-containing protein [Bacterioplanes sanyensis]ASP38400.1 acyl-CoA dehydrogenase [Bacterioplanes sanyensis]